MSSSSELPNDKLLSHLADVDGVCDGRMGRGMDGGLGKSVRELIFFEREDLGVGEGV